MATVSFAQNVDEKMPVYSGIHHYSAEVKKMNIEYFADSAYIDKKVKENQFDAFEVKEIFSFKFKDITKTLEQINQTAKVKTEGMIVADEYGRKIYFAIEALKNYSHILLESGETKNGMFFPNIISTNGVSYKENEKNPGTMIEVPQVIYFKTNP